MKQFTELLSRINCVKTGEIFIYKSGFIGTAYVDKEELSKAGGSCLNQCLRGMIKAAIDNSMVLNANIKTIAVIGPAYGAINYAPVVAEYLEEHFPLDIVCIPTRTQLDADGNHMIPSKLYPVYENADCLLIAEDVANGGTTIKEVNNLVVKLFEKRVDIAMCLVHRGKNTVSSLGIGQFFPFLDIDMQMFDPRVDPSIFDSGMKINVDLGKGAKWVEEFGEPPYEKGADFSGFSLFKD